MRVWLSTFPRAGLTQVIGRAAEDAGFHGLMLTDSQVLAPDSFVELTAVAEATTTLRLGTCATNVLTRHPTVVAGMAMTLQGRSAGRMSIGIARGDSAVTKVGLHPLPPEAFGAALAQMRQLLRGESIEMEGVPVSLTWLDPALSPPAVIGVASGPHAIDEAARNADGLIIQVGSDPVAIRHSVDRARAEQARDDFTIAVYVIVGLERDGSAPSIEGVTPVLARMATETLAEGDSRQARASAAAARSYSVTTHGLASAAEGQSDIDDYAVRGTSRECLDALREIADTGCDELVVILDSMTTAPAEVVELVSAFGRELMHEITEW